MAAFSHPGTEAESRSLPHPTPLTLSSGLSLLLQWGDLLNLAFMAAPYRPQTQPPGSSSAAHSRNCLNGWTFGAWKYIEKRITNTHFTPLGLRNRMSQGKLSGGTVFVSFHRRNCCLELGVYHLHECVYFDSHINNILSYWTTYLIMDKCVFVHVICCGGGKLWIHMYMWVQARGKA